MCQNSPKRALGELCPDVLERHDDVLGRIITSIETWVLAYGPETKRQSTHWKSPDSPRPRKFRQSKSKRFDIRWIVRYGFVLPAQTVNRMYYFQGSREKVRRQQVLIVNNSRYVNYNTHGTIYTTGSFWPQNK